MQPDNLGLRHREHAEWIILAQIVLGGERKLCEISKVLQIVRVHAGLVERAMAQFKQSGSYAVEANCYSAMTGLFEGTRLDDDGTLKLMGEIHRATGDLIDPHSAVGVAAMRAAHSARLALIWASETPPDSGKVARK